MLLEYFMLGVVILLILVVGYGLLAITRTNTIDYAHLEWTWEREEQEKISGLEDENKMLKKLFKEITQ